MAAYERSSQLKKLHSGYEQFMEMTLNCLIVKPGNYIFINALGIQLLVYNTGLIMLGSIMYLHLRFQKRYDVV